MGSAPSRHHVAAILSREARRFLKACWKWRQEPANKDRNIQNFDAIERKSYCSTLRLLERRITI
jgi:hypothetical protein